MKERLTGVKKATSEHLDHLVGLFEGYRVFYKQKPARKASRVFLKERLKRGDSVIFMAYREGVPVGFVQLFPSFSSVSLEGLYILNDLYVEEAFRGEGIGALLLEEAKTHCIFEGYKGLALETAPDNPAGRLYEREGWTRDGFHHYFWPNPERQGPGSD